MEVRKKISRREGLQQEMRVIQEVLKVKDLKVKDDKVGKGKNIGM